MLAAAHCATESASDPSGTPHRRLVQSMFTARSTPAEAEGCDNDWSCDGDGCGSALAPGSRAYMCELKPDAGGDTYLQSFYDNSPEEGEEFILCDKCFAALPAAPAATCTPSTATCPASKFVQAACSWDGMGSPAAHLNTHLRDSSLEEKIPAFVSHVISPLISFCDFCSSFYDNSPGEQHYRSHADTCAPLRTHLSAAVMSDGGNDGAQQGMATDVVVTSAPFSQNTSGSLFCVEDSWLSLWDFGMYTTVLGDQDSYMCFWLCVSADLDAAFVFQQPTVAHQSAAAALKSVVAPRADALRRQQSGSSAFSQKG